MRRWFGCRARTVWWYWQDELLCWAFGVGVTLGAVTVAVVWWAT